MSFFPVFTVGCLLLILAGDIESNPGPHSTFICPVYLDHIEDLNVSVMARGHLL